MLKRNDKILYKGQPARLVRDMDDEMLLIEVEAASVPGSIFWVNFDEIEVV